MYSYRYVYVLLLLCMFCSGYSVSLFCSVYCLCVNVSTQLQLTKYIILHTPLLVPKLSARLSCSLPLTSSKVIGDRTAAMCHIAKG